MKKRTFILCITVVMGLLILGTDVVNGWPWPPKRRLNALPALHAEKDITISGLSSGAFMAVQMHLSHSQIVRGAGVFAGGIYDCAQGQLSTALSQCMKNPNSLDSQTFVTVAQKKEQLSLIDPLSGLRRSRVYIFSSSQDTVVEKVAGEKLAEFYQSFASDVATEYSVPAAHGWPTFDQGHPCSEQGPKYIQSCGFDGSGTMLKHLITLQKPRRKVEPHEKTALQRFDQEEFGSDQAEMADSGFVFIPPNCRQTKCRVHVALHGCAQSESFVGYDFVEMVGLNEWAIDNDLIVLYPQAKRSLTNAQGCWDWYGYTGPDYPTRRAPQIEVLKRMVDRLSN